MHKACCACMFNAFCMTQLLGCLGAIPQADKSAKRSSKDTAADLGGDLANELVQYIRNGLIQAKTLGKCLVFLCHMQPMRHVLCCALSCAHTERPQHSNKSLHNCIVKCTRMPCWLFYACHYTLNYHAAAMVEVHPDGAIYSTAWGFLSARILNLVCLTTSFAFISTGLQHDMRAACGDASRCMGSNSRWRVLGTSAVCKTWCLHAACGHGLFPIFIMRCELIVSICPPVACVTDGGCGTAVPGTGAAAIWCADTEHWQGRCARHQYIPWDLGCRGSSTGGSPCLG